MPTESSQGGATAVRPGPLGRVEARLAAHSLWILIGLIAGSVLFRVAYYASIDGGPCSRWHQWEDGDPNFFDLWGRRIAEGDWLTNGSVHPLHGWHKRVAYEHFLRHRAEEAEGKAAGRDPARDLWNRWYGEKLFHQEPLYPYLIGVTYKIFGADPRAVYAWQLALGVLTNLLIWWIARRHFGDLAGAIAAGLALFCGPLQFYEMTLVRTSLTVFASLGLLALFERALDRGTWVRWGLAGVGLGLALLLQTIFILFALGAVAVVAWRHRDRHREGLRAAAALALGTVACLAPAFIRNAVVGAPLFGLSSVGSVTFVAANWPDSDPTRGWAVDERAMARLMSETKGDFGKAMRTTLDQHSPVTFFQLTVRKLKMLLRDYELPNNKNFLYYRWHAPILAVGFVGFGLILPFALVGFHAAWKERGRHALLFWLIVSSAAPMLLFYVLARFRAPLAAALIPVAAFGVVQLLELILAKSWRPAVIAGGVVVVTALGMFRPLPGHMRPIRSADYRIAFRTWGGPREQQAVADGDYTKAVGVLEEALREEPAEVRALEGKVLPEGGFEIRQITDFFRSLHARRAGYLEKLGKTQEAAAEAAKADALRRSLGGVPSAPWTP